MAMKIKKRNRIILLSIVSLIVVSLFLGFFYPFKVKSHIPEEYIGNWINEKDNNWEYGFFEDFIVFDNDFWDYQHQKSGNENRVNLILTKQGKKIRLQLTRINQNQLAIKRDNEKEETFSLMGKAYPNYPNKEIKPFSTPTFQIDSVTVIGYYRNLDKGIKGFVERFFRSPFEIAISDFITGEEVKYYGDIDNLGRFKVTFPVINTQELYVDWKRTRIRAVVEPGETLFLFADISDYIPTATDKKSYEAYTDRSKQVLFMGNNARLNNEIRQYTSPWISVDKSRLRNLDDMEYLRACEDVYNKRIGQLNEHIEKNPTVSEKFRIYKQKEEKYDFAFNLMQHRFALYERAHPRFQDGYIKYVEENFPLNDELDYTLIRYFNTFLSDYIGYVGETLNTAPNVLFDEIGDRLQADGKLTPDIQKQIKEINELAGKIDSVANRDIIAEELRTRTDKLNANDLVKEVAGILHSEKSFLNTAVADSLIINPNLRELWITNRYHYWFEVLRKPLSVQKQVAFKQQVKNPSFRDHIDKIQKYYGDIANEDITYEASLKNTKDLNEYKEAEKIFEELIKPYKGKVIYVDFWGTWCSGCRRDLGIVNNLKEKLQGEDVVFMYFANRSPEDTWKNLIKEMNLTGENVVHYRLPDVQQAMIERKLGVAVFPTYILINKEGIVVNSKAKSPTNIDGAVQEIKDLLK